MDSIWYKRHILQMIEGNSKCCCKDTSCSWSLRLRFFRFYCNNWRFIKILMCLFIWFFYNLLLWSYWFLIVRLSLKHLMRSSEICSLVKMSWMSKTLMKTKWSRCLSIWINPIIVWSIVNNNIWLLLSGMEGVRMKNLFLLFNYRG